MAAAVDSPGLSDGRPVECVVVGGGIAGCAIAWELATRGQRVLLLERDTVAAAASGHNTGTLLSQGEPEVMQLLRESVGIYQELEAGPFDFHLRQRPQLLLARDAAQLAAAQQRAEQIAALGGAVAAVDGGELRRHFPLLREGLAGGYVVSEAWTLDPLAATASFAHAARQAGAVIRSHTRVLQLAVRAGRIEGVLTEDGPIPADTVVLASGPWLNELLRDVERAGEWLRLPVSAGRGWLLSISQVPIAVPWIIEEISWPDQEVLGKVTRERALAEVAAGTQEQPAVEAFVLAPVINGGALLGASLAPALRGVLEGSETPQRLARRALDLAPGLGQVAVADAWYDFRPMMADGLPVAGETLIAGLYVHGGHGSLGMQAAPATARWLADRMTGRGQADKRPWLDPRRFVAHAE
jgi:glycine/D-amino acid oxidase-like deaminating enzyme